MIPRVFARDPRGYWSAVDVVEGLDVHEIEGHVRRAEQNRACVQEPAHGDRMRGRLRRPERRHPPGTWLAVDAEALLDVDRNAVQRPVHGTAANRLICARRRRQRVVAQLVDVGVEGRLERVDAPQCVLRQFNRRNHFRTDGCSRIERRAKVGIEVVSRYGSPADLRTRQR
jgi:hypothetical protein